MLVTKKAQELDVVELTEDLPEYGMERGAQGTVVSAFDEPDEAYDLEFVDDSGKSTFAYAVKPTQITSGDEVAERMFANGLALLEECNLVEAEQRLRETIRLRPHYAAVLHNLVIDQFHEARNWAGLIGALRLIIRLNPDYQVGTDRLADYARENLSNAYNNLAIDSARRGDSVKAILLFDVALAVGPGNEMGGRIRRNLTREYTSMGIQAHQRGELKECLLNMLRACEIEPGDRARHNVGVALVNVAMKASEDGDSEEAGDALQWAIDSGLFDSRPDLLRELTSHLLKPEHSIQGLAAEFIPATPLQELDFNAAAA